MKMSSVAIQETGAIGSQDQIVSLKKFKRNSRKDAISNILWGSGFVLLHIVLLVFGVIGFSGLFRSLLFIIGAIGVVVGAWEYYQARRLTIEDLNKHNEAQE